MTLMLQIPKLYFPEKYIAGKRSMECKQKQLGGLVRNKIKHRKKYKIGKSPTPLGKITIVL
jgi:hypothetical protein